MTAALANDTVRGGLKSLGSVTLRYTPNSIGVLKVVALLAFGFALVRKLAPKES